MEKLGCAFGIIVFIFVTMLVMFTDIGTVDYTVKFSSQELAINNPQKTTSTTAAQPKTTPANISNKKISYSKSDLEIDTREIYNSGISLNNKNTIYNNSGKIYNTTGQLSSEGRINNTSARLKNKGRINNQNTGINKTDIKHLKAGLKPSKIKTKSTGYENINPAMNQFNPDIADTDMYGLQNIDWRTWRSNFVNRITDDSFYIPELNKYPTGTMFHYFFTVDNTGHVYNVRVTSLNISKEDREKIAEMIRGYSYTPITKFPANSKRKTANVSAILLFSNETEYSTPNDFYDLEQIKIKL